MGESSSWSFAFHNASLPTELSCLFVMLHELKTWLINEWNRDNTRLHDFPTGPNKNRAVRPQNMTIDLKFRNWESRRIVLYRVQLCGYRTTNLVRGFFVYVKSRFSHDAAQRYMVY